MVSLLPIYTTKDKDKISSCKIGKEKEKILSEDKMNFGIKRLGNKIIPAITKAKISNNLFFRRSLFNWTSSFFKPSNDQPVKLKDEGIKSIGSFEEAPEIPSLLLLPNTNRPLIPGYSQPYFLRNEETINKIEESIREGKDYVGVFLRKTGNLVIEEKYKDIITSVDQIYKIGR